MVCSHSALLFRNVICGVHFIKTCTEITNTGMELSSDRVSLKNLGKAPVLLRTGKLDLKLKLAPGKQYTLYPLRSDGFRREGIPLKTKDGITEISLNTAKLPNGPAFYFELEGK